MDARRSAREFRHLHGSGETGLDHLGIQVETAEELQEVYKRLQQADRPVLEQGATVCCYAKSEKSWVRDPQGVSWEAFLTSGESTVYGDSADPGACCTPKPDAPCCGQGAAESPRP
jgi:hypothetical protein